jgi:hypothetical protein
MRGKRSLPAGAPSNGAFEAWLTRRSPPVNFSDSSCSLSTPPVWDRRHGLAPCVTIGYACPVKLAVMFCDSRHSISFLLPVKLCHSSWRSGKKLEP